MGNSSTGIYEAPIFGVPAINIGSRQFKRSNIKAIRNLEIHELTNFAIHNFINTYKKTSKRIYGNGKTAKKFIKIINKKSFGKFLLKNIFQIFLLKQKNR